MWGISEIEPLQMQIVIQTLLTPKEKRDVSVVEAAAKGLERPLGVPDAHLAARSYLLGDEFTIADLNVAAVMLLLKMVKHDYSTHANIQRWAEACYARPGLAAAQAKG